MLVTVNPTPGQYYNIGGTYTCEISDVLNQLLSMSPMRERIKIVTDPDRLRPIDADLQVPNTEKFRLHTGWKPEISFETTMRDLLNYWRERVAENNGKFVIR
jgi:GDPmannose 4,6-dehydratase